METTEETSLEGYALSYFRWSYGRQEKGSTKERQEAYLNEFLRANPKVKLYEQYIDGGVSGFRGRHAKKGDLARLLDAVAGDKLPRPLILVIEALDRLSREPPMDAFDRISDLLRRGVTIVVCSEYLTFTRADLNGRRSHELHRLLNLMERAHGTSLDKRRHVQNSWTTRIAAAQATGVAVKGYVGPPWCSIDPATNRYVIAARDVAAVEVVQRIYRWRIDGVSDHGIAKRLNEGSVPVFRAYMPKDRVRQGWYQPYIATLLKNRQVLGEHRFRNGQVIPNYFPPIISPEDFERAQAAKKSRDSRPGAKGEKFSNLLTGIAKCGRCGGNMEMTRNTHGTRYLMCANRKRRVKDCDAKGMLNYKALEAVTLAQLPGIPWDDVIRCDNPDDPVPALREGLERLGAEIAVQEKEQANAIRLLTADPGLEPAFARSIKDRHAWIAEAKLRLDEQAAALKEAEQTRDERPHLKATALAFWEQIEAASPTERAILRERLSGVLSTMISGMECDTLAKTAAVTYGSRYAQGYKVLVAKPPAMFGSMWLTQPRASVPWQEIAISCGGVFDPDLFEHLHGDAIEEMIAARERMV